MRPRVPGMNEVDDTILEYFVALEDSVGYPVEQKAGEVHRNVVEVQCRIDRSDDTIARRMRRLSSVGLLENTDSRRGYYAITDMGRRYLVDNLTAMEVKALRRAYAELMQ